MIRTVISMPGSFYSDGMIRALEGTGNFRTQNIPPGAEDTIVSVCREWQASILLMGVSLIEGFKLAERREIVRQMRSALPQCKLVLFVDDAMSQHQTEGIKELRFTRQIDGFVYTSCSMEYLVDTLETVI